MGAILGTGLIDAGGRNVSLTMQSRAGFAKMRSAVGLALFAQHWYWHPMIHMLNLSFTPSYVCGLNRNFEFPKGFEVQCTSPPSSFAYPKRLTEKKEVEKKRITTVTLSTSAKTKAKNARKKAEEGDDSAMDVDKNKPPPTSTPTSPTNTPSPASPVAAEKKKKFSEAKNFRVPNPSRVTSRQTALCEFDLNQRYRPVLTGAVVSGIMVLTDSTPEVEEDVVAVTAPALQTDEEPLPGAFIWTPAPTPTSSASASA